MYLKVLMNGYTHSHILALFKTLEKTQTGTKRKSVLMLLDTFLVLTEEIEQNTYFKKDKFPNKQQYKGSAEKNPLMWGYRL